MIVYQPKRKTMSASIKEEESFATLEEMIRHLLIRYQNVSHYIGASKPLCADDIVLDGNLVKIRRLYNDVYKTPHCVGLFMEC
jgi:hypothetical protein